MNPLHLHRVRQVSSEASTHLAISDAPERVKELKPFVNPVLLLDLRQERHHGVDHLDDGLFELSMPLGQEDDGRIDEDEVVLLVGKRRDEDKNFGR